MPALAITIPTQRPAMPSLQTVSNTDSNWLETALTSLKSARVTVFGDFCLDAYWTIDPGEDELSLETSLPVRRVRAQRYAPGGAGNVATNLLALGVAQVRAVGLLGKDFFGDELARLIAALGACTDGLLRAPVPWQTTLYAKPCCGADELNRFDFGTANPLPPDSCIDSLLAALDDAARNSDAIVINQQIQGSIVSHATIPRINALITRHPRVKFLIDSRHHAASFRGAIIKANAREAAHIAGHRPSSSRSLTRAEAAAHAIQINAQTGHPVFITRGEHGLLVADKATLCEIPGIQDTGKTDPVGAGDTVVASLAAVLANSTDTTLAARLANLAASITVRKIHTTGTATPAELCEMGPRPDHIYEPELAASPRLARYRPGTEIEIIRQRPEFSRRETTGLSPTTTIRHAIFDHDGTLSTLRQGWEAIMEPMMMRAILGPSLETASSDIWQRVEADVRAFIDRTTGIQTLAQMKGLASLVREYGFVPKSEILDEHGYKAIYNDDLLNMVHSRIQKIERGELAPADFEIKNARNFLEILRDAGVKLYLASGTDEADVKAEAAVMGYAHLFEGGIHGAVGDLKVEAKRLVIDRIINAEHLTGSELLIVGDGPVELREGVKRGAICLGVASNELCRYGLDPAKRARLIRAGADIVIPDYSQLTQLRPLLGL